MVSATTSNCCCDQTTQGLLAGKVAVVTGATSGPGEEIGRKLSIEGARVLLTGRSAARGECLDRELGTHGRFWPADLTQPSSAGDLMNETVQHLWQDRYNRRHVQARDSWCSSRGIHSDSKGAMLALSRAAAINLAPTNIRVNAVAPGTAKTPLYDDGLNRQDDPASMHADVISKIPLRRLGALEQ